VSLTGAVHSRVIFDGRVTRLAELLSPLLPSSGSLLDVGCGDGSVAAAVVARRPDLRVRGVDVLVRPSTRIPVAQFDGTRLPFPDRSFDAVTFVDVLHHTDDPAALLAEAARVSRGAVVVKDHVVSGVLARPTLRLMDRVGNAHHGVRLPYNYLTESQWRALLARVGLEVGTWTGDLRLYPVPLRWWFDRRLHVVFTARPG
jgi:ubiquinone/menaquinone biosynthesis C-methylase UbiE